MGHSWQITMQQKLDEINQICTHNIFALDDSESMSINNKWSDLMMEFKKTIMDIKKFP